MAKKKKKKNIKKERERLVQKDWTEKVIYYLFLSLAFFVPLLFSRITYDQFDMPKITFFRTVSLIIIFLYAYSIFLGKRREVRWHPYLIFLFAFVTISFISTLFSISPATAFFGKYRRFEGSFTFLLYATLTFIFLQIFKKEEQIKTLFTVGLGAGVLSSFYGILQYFQKDPLEWGQLPFEAGRAFSTMGNPALYGGLLTLFFPLSIALTLASKDSIKTTLYATSTFLIFFALGVTFNRSGWLASVVALLLLLFFLFLASWKKKLSREPLYNYLFLLLLLFAILGIIQYQSSHNPSAPMNVLQRAATLTSLEEGTFAHRIEIWRAAWHSMLKRPILGWGPDTFRLVSRIFQTRKYTSITPNVVADNVHNFLLQVGSGTGFTGLLTLILFLGSVLYQALRLILNPPEIKPEEESRYLLNLGILLAGVAYFINLLFNVSIVGSSLIFWFMIASVLTQSDKAKTISLPPKIKTSSLALFALVGVGFLSATGIYVSLAHYLADYYVVEGARWQSVDPLKAEQNYLLAVNLNPYNERYPSELGKFYLSRAQASQSKEEYEKAEKWLKRAVEVSPYETDSLIFLADFYRIRGVNTKNQNDLKKSLQYAERALKICPYLYSGYLEKGLVYQTEGKWRLAAQNLSRTVDLYPGYALGWQQLGFVYEKSGEKRKALLAYKKALELEPTNQVFKQNYENLEKKLQK